VISETNVCGDAINFVLVKQKLVSLIQINFMKKFLQISSVLLVSVLYGQQISDYHYILIPDTFANAKANRYDLDKLLSAQLQAKKFIVITENSPESKNLCEYLKAEISDTGNMLTNKVRIEFKDCYNKSLAILDGKSRSKDIEEGMQDALKNAMMNIPLSNPVKNAAAVQKESAPINTQKEEKTENIASQISTTNTTEKANVYSNGSLSLNKILLSNGEFILADPNSSAPYGIFKPSTKKDTYRVQLQDGTTTLGYLEDGEIIVEIPNADGSFKKEIFAETIIMAY
jgi:archaellum component FlaF (FlaF/FlaG flagellin family)